jgi:hypothetical protein
VPQPFIPILEPCGYVSFRHDLLFGRFKRCGDACRMSMYFVTNRRGSKCAMRLVLMHEVHKIGCSTMLCVRGCVGAWVQDADPTTAASGKSSRSYAAMRYTH